MRPTFADTVIAEAGVRIEPHDLAEEHDRASSDAAYREWRASRVVFMHPEADPYRQRAGTVPTQRDGRPAD